MASYDTGYEDELFEHAVSPSFHCIICTNVIKDPVACRHNEHLFCRACITEHLKNHQKCPTCMDPLTVDTLSQVPRTLTNLLAELKIQCKFFDRGCGKFIELGNLESHVRECGFAPAVCSNEGCAVEVNKQDLLHHETAVCEQRRVKCHSCSDIRQEMDIVNVKMDKNDDNLKRIEVTVGDIKAVVETVAAKVELVQEQLNNQEVKNRDDTVEIKECLNEMTKQLERMAQQASHEVPAEREQMKKGIAEAAGVDGEPKVVIAGGSNGRNLNSVEMFSLSNGTWTRLQPMRGYHEGASSVVYNNQFIVMGGRGRMSMEKLSLNAVHADQSITWENVPAELSGKLQGHCSVAYNGRLIVIGGFDMDKSACSDRITEISLVPPYTCKELATMPQERYRHGVAMFRDKIVIVGGRKNLSLNSALKTVVMYDITKGQFTELPPLPYPVSFMATVKWGDDNVIIMGGADSNYRQLNTVLIYNVKTGKSHMLPDMKYKRYGCVAAVVGDTVIVMGGRDERGNDLKSVECFRFDRYTWEELLEMHEARWRATAAVC